jgi:hypothetical protein
MSEPLQAVAGQVADNTKSFFHSDVFHNHIRSWTFVVLAIFLMSFLWVHESNSNTASNATAAAVLKQGQETQAALTKQIDSVKSDTASKVAVIQAQADSTRTVAQAIAALRTASGSGQGVSLQPIIVEPAQSATASSAALSPTTTGTQTASGDTPVATITGNDLKTLADNAFACDQNAIKLDGCRQELNFETAKVSESTKEVAALKSIKQPSAWKRTLTVTKHVAVGILIGTAIGASLIAGK